MTIPTSMEKLREKVKNGSISECVTCPRNAGRLPIMFSREDGSLAKIKFLVLSEEVPATYKNKTDKKIEKDLIDEVLSGKGKVPRAIHDIFGSVNIASDNVYWTHSMKCVPNKNHEYKKRTIKECVEILKQEIAVLPNIKAIVVFGGDALSAIQYLGTTDIKYEKIKEIYDNSPDKGYLLRNAERKLRIFPFFHPAHAYIHENSNPTRLQKKEIFIKELRKIDKG